MVDPRDTDGTPREKRWLVLASDGRHTWLGRHSEPADQEITAVTQHLVQSRLGGWLCIGEGVFWSQGSYSLLEVGKLAEGGDFAAARDEFLRRRMDALADLTNTGQ